MFCFKSYKQQDHAVFHNLDAQLGLFLVILQAMSVTYDN